MNELLSVFMEKGLVKSWQMSLITVYNTVKSVVCGFRHYIFSMIFSNGLYVE
jgi:hypothetical protein